MNISPILQYKVIEHEKTLAIIGPTDTITGANNLIIADMATCCEFLIRYTEHRMRGKEVKAALELALRGANIISNVKGA